MPEGTLTGQVLAGYEIGRFVGKGASGTVYQARRAPEGPGAEPGPLVALKVLHPDLIADERSFKRFEREAELGLRIRHPHVVPTLDCGAATHGDDTLHYMVMEFVRGEPLRDMLAELGTVPEDLLYQIADQTLDALDAIHGEGMIHRDVKPENIVITPDHRVLLMDLGIARLQQEGRDLTLAGEFIGSLAYAAPEQFTDQDHVDPRADLYAMGVLLYEMATGVNPFDEPNLMSLIDKKLRTPLKRPRLLNRDLDPFLDEVIQTCLEVAPDARFASCAELRGILAERDESAWWQARIEGQAFPAAARALRRLRPPRDAPLVGRERELAGLHACFDTVRAGAGAVALVSGPAGIGKSRLVHDFLEDLMTPDGPVLLAGRCPKEAGRASHPFLEAIGAYLGERKGAEQRLLALVPQDAPHVSALTRQVFGEATEVGDAGAEAVVTGFLGALARERPVVLAIEDLQWADPSTAALLERLARQIADEPILVVATWRPDALEPGSAVHALTATLAAEAPERAITLPPLSRDAVEAVLQALVAVPRTVRALGWPLTQASAGNPHFLLEIVEHLRQSGGLVESEGGWVPAGPVTNVVLPQSLRLLLLVRLVGVEPELMQLLEAAAAQGPEFDASVLAAVSGQKRLRLLKRLAVLERKHGIVDSLGRSAFRFASHALWQVVYGGMRAERRQECHALCAAALRDGEEQLTGERAYDWVRHQLAAGNVDEALEHAPAAITHAATQVHAVRGLAFLDELEAALASGPPALRSEVFLRTAALHGLLGHPDASRTALEAAAREAEAAGVPGPQARVAVELATSSLRAGDLDAAREEAERALAFAQESGEATLRARALHAAGGIAMRAGRHERSAACFREALELWRQAGDGLGEANTLLQLGRLLAETGSREDARAAREAALEAFRACGDRRGEAAALDGVGRSWAEGGDPERALECYRQALAVARDLGDLPAEATTLHNVARLHATESRIEEARASFEKALDIFQQLGDPAGEAATLDELGTALASFGDHDVALGLLERAQGAAERLGEQTLRARIARHLARVRHDTGDRAGAWGDFERALELGTSMARAPTLAEMAAAALAEEDPERAIALLEDALASGPEAGMRLVLLARLARAHHEAGHAGPAGERAAELEALLADVEPPPHLAPEVYFALASVLAEAERAGAYLAKANALIESRTRAIRSAVYREHYLTSRWPNREILTAVRARGS